MAESLARVESLARADDWAIDWVKAGANPLSVFRGRTEWMNLATEVLARRSWILTDQLGFCVVLVGSIIDDGLTIEPARTICRRLLTAEYGAKHKGSWDFYQDFHALVAQWKADVRRARDLELLRKADRDGKSVAALTVSISEALALRFNRNG